MELPCKLSRRYADGFKLMGEDLTWMMDRFGQVTPHVIAADERRRFQKFVGLSLGFGMMYVNRKCNLFGI